MLGRPLIPWQRYVADLTGERLPSGRLAYARVVLIVPRRAGKSVLALARALTVASGRDRRVFYTSAHRENAARMWRDDWMPTVEASPLWPRHVKITRGNGTEAFVIRAGSTVRLVAPTGAAIRNAATALAIVDEAREISEPVGDDLESAIFPTQATIRGGAQTWIVSNAGTADSGWLARWRDTGRAGVDAGRTDTVAHIEYAAPPDSDPDAEATWWAAHPGLGFHVDIDALRADRATMDPSAFAAEYLGWWPEAFTDTRLIEAWTASTAPAVTLSDPVVFGVDVDEDRTSAVVVAVAADPSGPVAVELVDARPLGPWLAPRLAELAERWNPAALVWDAAGPANALAPELEDVPTRLVPLMTRDVTAAAGWLYDRILDGVVAHRPDPDLDRAVTAARRRRVGGSWTFDRRQPGAGPLIAATLAGWVSRTGGRPPTVT